MPRAESRAVAAVLLAVTACSGGEPSIRPRFVPAELNADFAVIVILDEAGAPARVEGPLLARGYAEEIIVDADRVVVAAFDRAALRELVSDFDESRERELAARIGTACAAGPAVSAMGRHEIDLSRVARASSASGVPFEPGVVAGVTLSVPTVEERCRRSVELAPFAAGAQALPAGVQVGNVALNDAASRHVAAVRGLAADRALVALRRHLVVIERGRVFVDDPAKSFDLQPAGAATIRALAVDRGAGYPYRIAVAGERAGAGGGSALWDLRLDRGGFTLVRTATQTRAPIHDVVIDASGRTLAVGAGGLMLSRPSFDAPLVATQLATGGDLLSAVEAGDGHAIGTADGRVTSGTPSSLDEVPGARGESFVALTSARTTGGAELWAGTASGRLFRRPAGRGWYEIDLVVPDRYGPCGPRTADCGRELHASQLAALATEPSAGGDTARVALVSSTCDAVVEVRRSDGCVSVTTAGDRPLSRSASGRSLTAADVWAGRLLAGGEDGYLYALTLD